MFDGDAFWKWMFVITWLNVFVLLEPFMNKDGYRQIIFAKNATWKSRVGFFLAINAAFLVWGFALTARI
jgi:hypothetical protein